MRLSKFLPTLPETHSIAVFVGAMARGKDDFADAVVDHKISSSEFPLSASVACGKVSVMRQVVVRGARVADPARSSVARSKSSGTSSEPPSSAAIAVV